MPRLYFDLWLLSPPRTLRASLPIMNRSVSVRPPPSQNALQGKDSPGGRQALRAVPEPSQKLVKYLLSYITGPRKQKEPQ